MLILIKAKKASQEFTGIILKYESISSPAAVVADSDAVQASDSEDAQGQGNDDNVKHFELCVEEEKTGRRKTERNLIQLKCMVTVRWN